MNRRSPSSYEDLLAQSTADAIISGADQLAKEHGAPADSRRPSEREEVSAWGRTDPSVDYHQVASALMTTGMDPQQAQGLLLVKQHPDLLDALTKPQPPDLADQLARLAEFPYRFDLYAHLDPDERVAYAQRLHRLWTKSLGPADMADDPLRGADVVPSADGTTSQAPPEAGQPAPAMEG